MQLESPFKVLDLFSGAGGMSWGFHRQPEEFVLVGAVDRELGKPSKDGGTACNATYERNFGLTPVSEDLATVEPARLRALFDLDPGDLGVLISCAPCTGFSQKKASNHVKDDPRNQLVERSVAFVAALRPEFFVMENVKELIQGTQAHHFGNLRRGLAELGYAVTWGIHDLADFGVPQRRVRALILARREGRFVAQPTPPNRLRHKTVREAVGHLAALDAGQQDPIDPMHVCPGHKEALMDRIRAIPKDGGSWADIPKARSHLLIPSMRREDRRAGSFPDIYGRMWWSRPAVTITRECGHPGNGRYLHPEQDRMLSVREMALLQGFPPQFSFCGPLSSRYNQIGDAVPPVFAEQVARHVASLSRGEVPPGGQTGLGLYVSG